MNGQTGAGMMRFWTAGTSGIGYPRRVDRAVTGWSDSCCLVSRSSQTSVTLKVSATHLIPGRLGNVHSTQGRADDYVFFLVFCLALMYGRKELVQSWI